MIKVPLNDLLGIKIKQRGLKLINGVIVTLMYNTMKLYDKT